MSEQETFKQRMAWTLFGHALFVVFLALFLFLFHMIGWL